MHATNNFSGSKEKHYTLLADPDKPFENRGIKKKVWILYSAFEKYTHFNVGFEKFQHLEKAVDKHLETACFSALSFSFKMFGISLSSNYIKPSL